MAKKTYKNIHTIFEKAKRGDLGDDTPRARLFPKFNYNEKAELVKPYLHYIDERALARSVDTFMYQDRSHEQVTALAKRFNKQLPSPDSLTAQMKNIYNKFPKSMINDIFNVYYTEMQDLEFKDRGKSNKFRYRMLEKASNPVLKVLTKESNVKSMIFTRGLIQYFCMMMAQLEQEDPQQFKKMMDELKKDGGGEGDGPDDDGEAAGNSQGQGSGKPGDPGDADQKGDGSEQDSPEGKAPEQSSGKSGSGDTKGKSLQQQLKEMAEKFDQSTSGQKIMDQIMANAKKTAEQVDNLMTQEEQKDLWDSLGDKNPNGTNYQAAANKTDMEWLRKMEAELKKISLSMGSVKSKIKNMLDKSISYFSAREIPVYENIFETDNMGGLEDYPLLHPQIRKLLMEDINVKDIKRLGKIDIYIDVSGSMDSGCGVNDKNGHQVSKVTFSKAFAMKMKELNLLNKVYKFESSVRYVGMSKLDILTVGGGGGTDINRVVNHIKEQGRNAIVLTDAEDHCSTYSHQAYFIGVSGARFNSFHHGVLKQYADGKQMIIFDGNRTYNVDERGNPC